MGGNPYLGAFVELVADPLSFAGMNPLMKGATRAARIALKRKAISEAIPAYGAIVKKLPTYTGVISDAVKDLIGQARKFVPGMERMSPAMGAAEATGANTTSAARSILNRLRDVADIDIPVVPRSMQDPLVITTRGQNISPIAEALGQQATSALGRYVPLTGRAAKQYADMGSQANHFLGDLIMASKAGTKEGVKTLRHEGTHWADDLMTKIFSGGARPKGQTALAQLETGIAPSQGREIINSLWDTASEQLRNRYANSWKGLDRTRLAHELFADMGDPALSGLRYRTKAPQEMVEAAARAYERKLPGLAEMRQFAASKYNPAWEGMTQGMQLPTPTGLPADVYRMLSGEEQ
jgi:hypothetical protein